MDNKMNVIDLFCGCGGMSKGLTDAGLNVIAGIDVWDKAVENYNNNFEHHAYCHDLTTFPPEKFQETYNTDNKQVDLIVGGPPCFVAGTKVLTNNGFKCIEDVNMEDKLLTHTGEFQDIVNLQRKTYAGIMYRIKVKYHTETIECTEEHPFYVRERIQQWDHSLQRFVRAFSEPKWKPAKELSHNDYIGMVINNKNVSPQFGPMREQAVLADASGDSRDAAILLDANNSILDANDAIPEWVQNAPIEFIQEFVNSCMTRNENMRYISHSSYDYIHGLQRLLLKLGHISSVCKFDRKNDYHLFHYLNDDTDIMTAFIENNYAWYQLHSLTSFEAVSLPVYNFEVNIDNSYIVQNLIVHNCQSYSIAGKRDKDDPRNSLFMEFVKYIDYYNPKAFLMENVIGILSKKLSSGENVIDIIMSLLTRNYHCFINKLYASDFEVPQNRRRVIIVGIRNDLQIIPQEVPKIITSVEHRIPVKAILLPREQIGKEMFLSERAIQGIINKKQKSKEKGAGFGAQFLDMDKPSYTIPARYWKDGYDALVKYSETEIRRLTILELKRIQSFPDDYVLEGSKKDVITQIGNAVACRFAYHLGQYITNILHK